MTCEEAFWAGDKQAEGSLKSLITEDAVMIEKKGIDAIRMENFTRLMIISNEKWVVPATDDERRFFVLEVGDAKKQDTAYFAAIDAQMGNGGAEAFLNDLLEYKYHDFTDIDLRNPPKTQGLQDQVTTGLPPFEAWWRDVLIEGGFAAGTGFHELSERGTLIEKAVVLESQNKAAPKLHNKTTTGLTEQLKRHVPALDAKAKIAISATRSPAYRFPPLSGMRDAWTEKYGESPWGDEAVAWASVGPSGWEEMLRRNREKKRGLMLKAAKESRPPCQKVLSKEIEVSAADWRARDTRQKANKAAEMANKAQEKAKLLEVEALEAEKAHAQIH